MRKLALISLAGFLFVNSAAAQNTVEVPNVAGQLPSHAYAYLQGARLVPVYGGEVAAPDKGKVGLIAATDPPAGTQVPAGTAVRYFDYSKWLPPIAGVAFDVAVDILRQEGIEVTGVTVGSSPPSRELENTVSGAQFSDNNHVQLTVYGTYVSNDTPQDSTSQSPAGGGRAPSDQEIFGAPD